jgi:hypothetical protein
MLERSKIVFMDAIANNAKAKAMERTLQILLEIGAH